ncbi:hypothetical protein K1719_029539 [Acacia pycnantha]|nr:hypothetical protein K1719_029539 [Acacia pycnantha]
MSEAKAETGQFQMPSEIGIHEIDEESSKNYLNYKYACVSVVVASVSSMTYGYIAAVISGALLFIKEDLKISDPQVQLLAGMLNICSLAGSLTAGRIADIIGRRYTIIVASLLFMLGSILMGYGPSYEILIMGRCISGFGSGFALIIVPVYCAEISPPSSRGFLTCVPELSLNVGLLLGYASNYAFGKLSLKLGWRIMNGVIAIPSLGLAIAMLKMVESPRWLVMQGRVAEARNALLLLSNSVHEATVRLRAIKIAAGIDENCHQDIVPVAKQTRGGAGSLKALLWQPSRTVRRILMAAVGVHLFQQLSGFQVFLVYAPRIFEKAGMRDKNKLLLATVGMGIIKMALAFAAAFLLDKVGRRVLLLISSAGTVVSLLGLGVCMTMVEHSGEDLAWPISFTIVAVYGFVGFVGIGLGPVTWVYSSEIFPLRLRAQGLGIGVVVNRITGMAVIMTFITLYKMITMGGIFFVYCGATAISWCFYYVFLPETKGKSLEDMEAVFGKSPKSEVQTDPPHCNGS